MSPGQQFKLDRIRQLLAHPSHPVSKQALDSCYGIRPTTAARDSSATKRGGPPPRGQLATGVTVERHATLPRANRRDALVSGHTIAYFTWARRCFTYASFIANASSHLQPRCPERSSELTRERPHTGGHITEGKARQCFFFFFSGGERLVNLLVGGAE